MRCGKIFGVVLAAALASGCCESPVGKRAWIGNDPPPMPTTRQVVENLQTEPCEPINGVSRALGFLTTPIKNLGIFGWIDLDRRATVTGEVVQAARSTDGYRTLDLRIGELEVGGERVAVPGRRYMRCEVCERMAGIGRGEGPTTGDVARVAGELVWDEDGHLEIHPLGPGDVRVVR